MMVYVLPPLFFLWTAKQPFLSVAKLSACAIFLFGIVLIPVSISSTVSQCVHK